MQANCAAGQLLERINTETNEAVDGIYQFHGDRLVPAVADGEVVDTLIDDLGKNMADASARATRVRRGLEVAFVDMVNADSLDDSRFIEANDHAVEVERIIDELAELPHSTKTLEEDEMSEALQAVAEDIVRFAEQGLCAAATVAE